MIEALQFEFMRNALAAGVLVSIACGVIGTFVVLNRIVFISGGIAHAAYGGIGLGYLLGFDPILGALAFSVGSALAMGVVERKTRQRTDTIIGMMWAVGMALGILFLDVAKGYKADLFGYLFGSILAVPRSDLFIMLGIDVVIIVLAIVFYRELLAISFDETFATVRNVPVTAIYLVLLVMIGLTVVMMMRIVGLILVIALLTIPAAIAGQFARDMRRMMLLASLFGAAFAVAGLWMSYALNLTSGATIILVSAAGYMLSLVLLRLRSRRSSPGRTRKAR